MEEYQLRWTGLVHRPCTWPRAIWRDGGSLTGARQDLPGVAVAAPTSGHRMRGCGGAPAARDACAFPCRRPRVNR